MCLYVAGNWSVFQWNKNPVIILGVVAIFIRIAQGDVDDKSPNCVYWASTGECERNPKYMLSNCAKSCAKGPSEAESSGSSPRSESANQAEQQQQQKQQQQHNRQNSTSSDEHTQPSQSEQ
eukprot:gnl/MRDRNA2_/MRDRNA2_67427_c0_seq1.p1 gnl/MRDRNA2_/MRDRNA2_67427_c0~~gnl/MRDRNA2_/MRDRNA2_67427_c0_seq1.p1  ORF type:complete len:121 (+),score=26.09 gnl/MRDRNA2_/MRDRNA2_67427_c0_seq1:34-396(+)